MHAFRMVMTCPGTAYSILMDELLADVDATRHQRYWAEAFNGVALKMGLLALILGAAE